MKRNLTLSPPATARKIAELEARQDDVLERLDELSRRVERALAESTLGAAGLPSGGVPHGDVGAGSLDSEGLR